MRAAAQAVVVTGLWVLREQVQGSLPYGGFPWGRVVHMQADGPLAQAVSWLGFAGLSGVVVFACALPVAAWFSAPSRGAASGVPVTPLAPVARVAPVAPVVPVAGRRVGFGVQTGVRSPVALALAGSLALLLVLALVPAFPLHESGSLRVAAVQGNSKSGIFDAREPGEVLNGHIEATRDLLAGLEASGERVDLIVWPENSAEFEVRSSPLAVRRIEGLAERARAPIAIGTVLENPDGTYTNSSLLITPDGLSDARYDKRYPVPFAEYMPNRDFFHALAPDLVDLVQLEYTKGTLPSVVDVEVDGGAGAVRAGIAICFDIIFDQQAVAMVGGGAQLILAQTNNADFGRTDESAQQLAIARMRAIETGRALVNISTVGTSAIVAPGGVDLSGIEPHTAGAMVAEVPLVTGFTPALRFGAVFAGAWMTLGAVGLLAAVGVRVAGRRALRSSRDEVSCTR